MQRYIKLLLTLIVLISILSCNDKKKHDIKIKAKSKLDLKIDRFDRSISSINDRNFSFKLPEIKRKYPNVFDVYFRKVLFEITFAGKLNENISESRFRTFILDTNTQKLYNEVGKKYPDLKKFEKQLDDVFEHVKYYFPGDTVPHFYSMVSNFGWSAVSDQNMILVSLDFFIGDQFNLDPNYYPGYIRRCMKTDYMVPEMIKAYFDMRFPEDDYSGKTLLSKMIYAGKILYYLDLIMPQQPDTIKIEYKKDQLAWAERFEGEIWNQLLLNNVLFGSDENTIIKYLNPAPFTNAQGLPQETPPRIGEWIGWQIVKKYAEQDGGKNKINVFYEKDAQKILSGSRYKPKIR